jgi:hypothetical protein
VLRLGDVARLDIDVKVVLDRPGPRGENPGVSGRILKINAHTLDASPNSALPDKLEEIERFIDQLLAVFAG